MNNSTSEKEAFDFLLDFFDDFKSPSWKKGVVFGVAIGTVGTTIIGVLIYIVVR